ncbi:hypothetical protein AQV86_04515 [Nanohaloarchaea archaeon SG9]|nr:hypothetical protein AQV86_04515 [Nanohaloarchaea archaeon SG9]
MKTTKTILVVLVLAIAPVLFFTAGNGILDSSKEDHSIQGRETTNLTENRDEDRGEKNRSNRQNNTSETLNDDPSTEIDLLKEERIKPVKQEKTAQKALDSFMENSSEAAKKFIHPGTSSVFILESTDSKILTFVQTSEEKTKINLTVEGLDGEAIRGKRFISQRSGEDSFDISVNLTASEIEVIGFRLNDSVNVKLEQELPDSMKWQLISGPVKNLKVVKLDDERPLTIRPD